VERLKKPVVTPKQQPEDRMKVAQVFLSINAKDFDAQSAWWATFLGRRWDRRPMPTCHEWDLRDGVLFQVLDNNDSSTTAISIMVTDLDDQIARLRQAGVAIDEPELVPGFDQLRLCSFKDPEGNPVSLLEGH
jgi:hypothetical protein